MNYKKYFERLIIYAKTHGLDLKHYSNNYYLKVKSFKGYSFSLVVSSNNSKAYGVNFVGFIVELYISSPNFCESYLKQLEKFKNEIENYLGKLEWQKKEETVKGTVTRVYTKLEANIEDESKWDEYIEWQVNAMTQFLKVFPKYTKDLQNINEENRKEVPLKTKNIMLYGAPGVGKTHNYKKLISMIENGEDEITIFDTISKNENINDDYNEVFKKIKDEKRIEFVTFHQSYSYEDFIEGFRPNKEGKIELDKKGIFKKISDNAMKNLDNSHLDSESLKLEKMFEYFVKDCILYEEIKLSDTVYISNIDDKAFYYTSYTNGMKNVKIPFHDIKMMINNNLQEQREIKKLSNIMGTTKQRPNYPFAIYLRFLKFKVKMQTELFDISTEKIEQKNFYIVIDEINRGNISKIFGELITLIEEDKRDTYEVTLPYSKEKFKIPSNLYIIATMNSTDKSISTIDIALRRRFTFLKMKPNPNLVKYDNAERLMEELNSYIETHLSEDFKLGHSYFMKIENEEELAFVKEYKIKPLLEEYFYSDEKSPDDIISLAKKEYKTKEENTVNE